MGLGLQARKLDGVTASFLLQEIGEDLLSPQGGGPEPQGGAVSRALKLKDLGF